MARVSYPKVMRERAKADGKGLVTIDVPGMTFQGPVDNEVISKLVEFTTQVIFASETRKKRKAAKGNG